MFNWNMIETVLLDMDGTLLDLHFDNYFWQTHLVSRYAEHHDMPHGHAQQSLYRRFADTTGTLDWYCLDYWSRELELDVLALKREVDHLVAVHPFAEDFLKLLSGWKRLFLVTNAHPDSLALKLECTGIDGYFDKVISSHEYRYPKESQDFWATLQRELDFDPARTLLAEDNISILRAAEEYGIGHLLAVSRPDSRKAPNHCSEFMTIENFGEVLDLLRIAKSG